MIYQKSPASSMQKIVNPVHAPPGRIGVLYCPHAGTRQILCLLDRCPEAVRSIRPTFCPSSIVPCKPQEMHVRVGLAEIPSALSTLKKVKPENSKVSGSISNRHK